MRVRPVVWIATCLVGFTCSCRCSVPLGRALNDLADGGYRSWTADEEVSVISPWGEGATSEFQEQARLALRAVEAEFRTEIVRPLHVALMPVPDGSAHGDGKASEEKRASLPTIHGVEAYAITSENTVVILVGEGSERPGNVSKLLRTLRHEIAHLAANRLGLGGKTWFKEGLALEVEYASLTGERLLRAPRPEPLAMAGRVHGETRLEDVIHWAEDGGAILEGEEEAFWMGRPLAHSLMRFLLVRGGRDFGERGGFLEGLLEIRRLNEGEILALEPEWHAWLDEASGV